ncbi:MAG TPA: alanine--tRNA ligase [candidate division Zixibacteria bacterium]
MTAAELRQSFLSFFTERGHATIASSSLLIKGDPSLLFTNAGMNQFKSVFMGQEKRPYTTACSSQKCFRVSGKHNDLENVGLTPRHHTFFEMLGNFSFGDYFKEEAIAYAWEYLTRTLGLDHKRLTATVYKDDKDAEKLWRKIAPQLGDRVLRFGEKDNYWSMGDTGPCGPCSEIHYDLGEQFGKDARVNDDGDRFLEIWNLVFMQFDRQPDGALKELPKPSVDTGMGLERLAAIVQGKLSNYESDLFQPLIQAFAKDSRVAYDRGPKGIPHRVCADHLRGLVFTIADGGMPGNEGAGYVLRRILRRAARHGTTLGFHGAFLHRFVENVVEIMGDAYPELRQRGDHVAHVIESEENRFAETLDAGLARFAEVRKLARNGVIPGDEAFKLYDTYGFPLDLTEVLARERGLSVDGAGFEKALTEQRARSRAQTGFKDHTGSIAASLDLQSVFVYGATSLQSKLLWADEPGTALMLEQTPFYTEAGGQVDDVGTISDNGNFAFRVERMEKAGRVIIHHGQTEKGMAKDWIGKSVTAAIDAPRRRMIQRNHTATHLLHRALQTVLGVHAKQQGSLVAPDRLRFDFAHTGPMTAEQIEEVELIVNREVLNNTPVEPYETDHKKAIAAGVTALFGEKYGDRVRVVKIDDYSSELCGGTHVRSTGEIGLFRITSENGVAAGIRRIEAITGEEAYAFDRANCAAVQRAAVMLKTSPDKVLDRLESTVEEVRKLRIELAQLRQKLASGATESLPTERLEDLDMTLIYHRLADGSADDAIAIADQAKTRPDAAVAIVATGSGHVVLTVSAPAVKRGIAAGELLKATTQLLGGGGGGRPDFAKGKIVHVEKWDDAKQQFVDALRAMVKR